MPVRSILEHSLGRYETYQRTPSFRYRERLMNSCCRIGGGLTSFIIAVASGTAPAGALGQRSGATVSISVTIPPRLQVQSIPSVKADDYLGRGFVSQVCAAIGTRQNTYSITLVGDEDSEEASSSALAAIMEQIQPSDSGCNLHGGGSDAGKLNSLAEVGSRLSLKELDSPLILLIAPE